jgi:hypothetical protein
LIFGVGVEGGCERKRERKQKSEVLVGKNHLFSFFLFQLAFVSLSLFAPESERKRGHGAVSAHEALSPSLLQRREKRAAEALGGRREARRQKAGRRRIDRRPPFFVF